MATKETVKGPHLLGMRPTLQVSGYSQGFTRQQMPGERSFFKPPANDSSLNFKETVLEQLLEVAPRDRWY